MTFEQLEYFIAVAETDTFYTAADILHITQSALSKQIMKLEKELGIELFDRTHRSAKLTYAGNVFFAEASRLVLEYRKALNKMERLKSPIGKALTIGTLPLLDTFGLRNALDSFKEHHQETQITLDEVEEQELMFGLESDVYDFVLGNAEMFKGRDFSVVPFAKDELVCVVSDKQKIKSPITLTELSEHTLCLLNSYTATCRFCRELFAQKELDPDILRAARVGQILQLIRSGDAIGLLPLSSLLGHVLDDIRTISLRPAIYMDLVLASRNSSPETALLSELTDSLRGAARQANAVSDPAANKEQPLSQVT